MALRWKNLLQGGRGGVAVLLSGSVVSQVFGLLAYPALARLFSPSEFGEYGLFLSILSVLLVGTSLKYEGAIVLEENPLSARVLFRTANGISLVYGAVVSIVVGSAMGWMNGSFGYGLFYSIILAMELILGGLYQNYISWCTREQKFGMLSFYRVLLSIGVSFLPMAFLLSAWTGRRGLILGHVVAQAAVTILWTRKVFRSADSTVAGISEAPAKSKDILGKYSKFPKYSLPVAYMNTISGMLPVFILSKFYSSDVVGHYSMANKILLFPVSVVGASFAQAFLPRAVGDNRSGRLGETTSRTMVELFRIGFVPCIILMVIAPSLFSVVFGERWMEAGVYARSLMPWLFFVLIASPVTQVFVILNYQKQYFYINLGILALRFLALFWGSVLHWEPSSVVMLFGYTGALIWMVILGIVCRIAKVDIRQFLKKIRGILARNALPLLIVLPLWVFPGRILLNVVVGAVASVLFFVLNMKGIVREVAR